MTVILSGAAQAENIAQVDLGTGVKNVTVKSYAASAERAQEFIAALKAKLEARSSAISVINTEKRNASPGTSANCPQIVRLPFSPSFGLQIGDRESICDK